MAIVTYLQRPTPWQCVQWGGANLPDVQDVLSASGWSFTVDGDGNGIAHTPFGSSIPVDTTTWVLSGNGSVQFLDDASFTAQYIAGSVWAVEP